MKIKPRFSVCGLALVLTALPFMFGMPGFMAVGIAWIIFAAAIQWTAVKDPREKRAVWLQWVWLVILSSLLIFLSCYLSAALYGF